VEGIKLEYYLLFSYVYRDTKRSWQESLPQPLLDDGFIERLETEQDFSYKLTGKGIKYIEGLSPVYLVDCLLSMLVWRTRINRVIHAYISILSLEQLAGLLVYEDPDIRRLARYRFEELKNGTK